MCPSQADDIQYFNTSLHTGYQMVFSMAVTLINRLIGDDMFPHFWLKTAL